MTGWLGYSLRDFLMFGPEVYWRLFSLHNQALWPLPVVAALGGVAILFLVLPSRPQPRPVVGLAMALCWAGAALFVATRYAPINWPLNCVVWVFAAQAALSAVAGVLAAPPPASGPGRPIGIGLVTYSVLLHPLIGLGFGRPLAQAEVIGLAPDPTAIAGLGLALLMGRSWWRVALAIVPFGWCLVSAVTLLALGESQGWILVGGLGIWTAGFVAQRLSGARRDRPD